MESGGNEQRGEFRDGFCPGNNVYLHIPILILLSRISANKGEINVITNRNREDRRAESDRGLH